MEVEYAPFLPVHSDRAFAQPQHPFTFEDMMKLRRVGEPEVSPDGGWVLFSVVDVDLDANTETPGIWIVPTAGGQELCVHSTMAWWSRRAR
jgi:dipeptidyl aminopeptidase/acylaminoacyl peptidase